MYHCLLDGNDRWLTVKRIGRNWEVRAEIKVSTAAVSVGGSHGIVMAWWLLVVSGGCLVVRLS